jgi:hypothetical protein
MQTHKAIAIVALLSLAGSAASGAVVFSASGNNAASILPTVDSFRAALGTLNANAPGSRGTGRREINWDAVPDQFATPNAFPGNFFNAPAAPRARGAEFSTPGTQLQVSASLASNVGVEFGNLVPGLENDFAVFSPQRLFASLGSTVTVVDFFVPGTAVPATTRAFGAVFTDVDAAGSTTIELFDVAGRSLGIYEAPQGPTPSESLSFVGVVLDEAIVASVKIVSGSRNLESGGTSGDAVVMDDFIYGEPVCPADFNLDGQSDFFDYLDFAQAFSAEEAGSDVNHDGQVDFYDYLDFVSAFSVGCG